MTEVVIDLEALGTRPGCAILSIGAVAHIPGTPEDEKEEFYSKLALETCVSAGLKIEPDTLLWWLQQSPEVLVEAFSGTDHIDWALGSLSAWLSEVASGEGVLIYGKGPSFDCAILEAAYHARGMEKPWKFWNERCVRTVLDEAERLIGEEAAEGLKSIRSEVPHHALWDARAEMKQLSECRWRIAHALATYR
ncbi:MAG TPA: 3'-5' exonuclease [Bacteroidia bacterium]|nr:3'-5' exonuclease [Bacteroidia bacterium]